MRVDDRTAQELIQRHGLTRAHENANILIMALAQDLLDARGEHKNPYPDSLTKDKLKIKE